MEGAANAVPDTSETDSENFFVMTQEVLENAVFTDKAIFVLDGKGQFVRVPEFEKYVHLIPRELIIPNPKQPRTYFPRETIDELKESIRATGQNELMEVCPTIDPTNQKIIGFFIVGGERRFRAITELNDEGFKIPHVKCRMSFPTSEFQLLLKSIISNKSREDLNPIDTANSYKELIKILQDQDFERPEGDIIKEIAEKSGTTPQEIRKYLKLLTLSPEIQELIRTGALPKGSALHLPRLIKQLGADFNEAQLARKLLDSLGDKDESQPQAKPEERQSTAPRESSGPSSPPQTPAPRESSGSTQSPQKPITTQAFREMCLATLEEGGKKENAEKIRQIQAFLKFNAGEATMINAGEGLLKIPENDLIAILRNQGKGRPPEIFRDKLLDASGIIDHLYLLADKACKPDHLEIPEGKPTFTKYITSQENIFENTTQYNIAKEIAKASDKEGGLAITAAQIAKNLKIEDSHIVASNIVILRDNTLHRLGLLLEEHDFREKNLQGTYGDPKNAYRFNWEQKKVEKSPEPPAVTDTTLENPAELEEVKVIDLDYTPFIQKIATSLSSERLQVALVIAKATKDEAIGQINLEGIKAETGLEKDAIRTHIQGLRQIHFRQGITIGQIPGDDSKPAFFYTTVSKKKRLELLAKEKMPTPDHPVENKKPQNSSKVELTAVQKAELDDILGSPHYKILFAPETKGIGGLLAVTIGKNRSIYAEKEKEVGTPKEGEELIIYIDDKGLEKGQPRIRRIKQSLLQIA